MAEYIGQLIFLLCFLHGPRRSRLQVDQQKRQKKRARVALESHEKCQRDDLPGVSLSTGVML